jgi:orotidine-5'-phosphate decarboxylase
MPAVEHRAIDKLKARWHAGLFLCIGLDPEVAAMPQHLVQHSSAPAAAAIFNQKIIFATHDLTAAYKVNLAFYLQFGSAGIDVLEQTLCIVRETNANIPIILDAKFGDVEHVSRTQAFAAFETLAADAVTVSPLLGNSAWAPFLSWRDRFTYVEASAASVGEGCSADSQELADQVGLISAVASRSKSDGNVGVVVSAKDVRRMRSVREALPDVPMLVPGVGAQGGDLEAAMRLLWSTGDANFLISSARSIGYAGGGRDFATRARAAAIALSKRVSRNALQ